MITCTLKCTLEHTLTIPPHHPTSPSHLTIPPHHPTSAPHFAVVSKEMTVEEEARERGEGLQFILYLGKVLNL